MMKAKAFGAVMSDWYLTLRNSLLSKRMEAAGFSETPVTLSMNTFLYFRTLKCVFIVRGSVSWHGKGRTWSWLLSSRNM